jgi:cell division protein ZapA
MKQVDVSILGQVYKLGCPEGGEVLLANAVAAVNQEMTLIREAGKVRARERIAVLAALNLAYQLAQQGPGEPTKAATGPSAVRGAPADPASQKLIEALMKRIDNALSEDGQLL